MAIYHLTAKTVFRGELASAAARSEYIERAGRYKNDHAEVLYQGHGNMPDWAESPGAYWQAADLYERANGRLFKRLEFALPRELSPEEQTALAASFCAELARTKDGPLPYSFALHKGHDRGNPHCHLMLSERVNDGHNREPQTWFKRAAKDPTKGGAKKTNELRPREWLLQRRKLWAERANLSLQRAGHEARIDHRTLEAQGIMREPTTHLGPTVAALERQGIRTRRGEKNRLRETALSTPAGVEIAAQQKTSVSAKEALTLEHSAATLPTPKPTPILAPTLEECHAALLTIAKQEPGKMDYYYEEQIKPYMDCISTAEDKSSAFAFCSERMLADVTTEAPRLKEMSRHLAEQLRRTGATGTKQLALRQEAMNRLTAKAGNKRLERCARVLIWP